VPFRRRWSAVGIPNGQYVHRDDVIGGKWNFLIIKTLFTGTKRFGEIRKLLHDISPKTLTTCLRSLEKADIIKRTVYATVPATVEYSLTEKGESLDKIINEMYFWGEKWA
jgi:DNA-binding HxlR family transcriptional regulator